jgi:hypothetical protein
MLDRKARKLLLGHSEGSIEDVVFGITQKYGKILDIHIKRTLKYLSSSM